MRKLRFIVPALLAFLLLVSCTTFNIELKPWDQRSPEEKELFFEQVYNRQYEDTIAKALKAELTEPEKEIVRFKKKLLTEARSAIDLYVLYTVQSKPTAELEAKILELLDRIVTGLITEEE